MNNTEKDLALDHLSERELEILHLIEEGCTNREIAQRLVLSIETIKWYNKQIYSKLGVHNRIQAVANAKAAGLLGKPSEEIKKLKFTPPHNLPAQVTSFIGRQREIAEVQKLLADNRLLTLSGPPGTGKTRLALEVASRILQQFEDGVYFVELAPIRDPQFVPITIAKVFDIGESGSGSLAENLKHYLKDKQMLLVLDNYEQIIETAPLVGDLLAAARGLKVLVTSRQVLQVYGEQEYLVPPLVVPDLQRWESLSVITGCEAVELFCQRAHAVKPDFTLSEDNVADVADICVRLDGLPLAIELAAARSKLMSLEMIRNRLESRLSTLTGGARDLPSRLQTLRGTIDWSYDLLDEDEKVLFARLSVFQGGRTIEAAEAICTPGLPVPLVDGLESLLNKSLLYLEEEPGGEHRFMMLETLHEYAREKLQEQGEAHKLQGRHAVFFAELVEQAESKLTSAEQDYWFVRLRSEHDNLRAAMAFVLESGENEIGLRIVGALRDFWNYEGHVVEGLGWIQRALAMGEEVSPALRAKALNAAGWLSFVQGEYQRGQLYNRDALVLYRELGDQANMAWAQLFLAVHSAGLQGELERGTELIEQALDLFRAHQDTAGIIRALNRLGELARLEGDYDRAEKAYVECLDLCRQSGDRLLQAYQLANLGLVEQHHGNYQQAESMIKEGLVGIISLNTRYPIPVYLAILSGPVAAGGYPERAAQLLGSSDSLFKSMGQLGLQPTDQAEINRFEASIREQLDEDTFKAAWEKGQAMSLDEAVAYALEEDNN
jgi:predicted ATPase/DNA-binding CsgD family transcriptional regulator